ncbi:alpha/beta fold hydrolase [Yimella sp. cx-573]|nr:alpha/beta fold hydrolase [Yimella sp. cx-573]
MTSRSTRLRLAAASSTLALAATGCSGGSGDDASSTSPVGSSPSSLQTTESSSSSTAAGSADPAMAKFYSQKLTWADCEGVKCAKLTVPVDYANPGGATIQLALSKVPAKGKAKSSLVVNPGGPGASGYDYAAAADGIVTPQIREHFDVVGFDPRGVGRSAPITCYSDAQMDTLLGGDPTPDDKAEQKSVQTDVGKFAQACKDKAGPLLGHVSTVEVAKDMDVLRAALGHDKLDYLGLSYGTFIGSTYAGLFPAKVGRFVLDGVVPPDITSKEMDLGQAKGFETATRSYVQDCVSKGDCYLGSTVDQGLATIRDFLKKLDANPLPISGQGPVTKFTEGWASLGIAYGMYSKSSWPVLTFALKAAMNGDPNELMGMANQYAARDANGSYADNGMQSFYAVSCLDRASTNDLSAFEKSNTEFIKQAPTWGSMLAWGSLTCGEWKVPTTGKQQKITAAGAGPILVVGNTRDPATPYEFAQRLAGDLKNARLLTLDADGHTAYGQNSCINKAVDGYLMNGTLPAEGTKC